MPRPEIIDWVEENTGITECAFYASMTYGAYGAAVKSLLTGQFWLTGGLALVGRAAELKTLERMAQLSVQRFQVSSD